MEWMTLRNRMYPSFKERIKILFCRELVLTMSARANGLGGVDLGKVELTSVFKKGKKITPFIQKQVKEELEQCRRYYKGKQDKNHD